MTTAAKSEKVRVIVFDTTLRDGEQCPGATMTFEEKLEIGAGAVISTGAMVCCRVRTHSSQLPWCSLLS